MEKGFGQLAVDFVGRFRDPDKPQESHEFQESQQLARCIDLLLPTAKAHPRLADLPRRLHESATIVTDPRTRIDEARRAVDDLSKCFENYLQLIALLKYSDKENLLLGDNHHRGLLTTSLGGLLHGRPDPKNPPTAAEGRIQKANLVTYHARGGGRRDRIYRETKRIRNQVHSAPIVRHDQVFRDATVVLAAYLFATEENVKLISHSLYEQRGYLTALLTRLRSALPLVIEPEFESDSTDHRVTASSDPASPPTSFSDFDDYAVHRRPQMRFAIYGDPGAGKTTFAFELTRRLAQRKRRAPLDRVPLPVLIEASRLTENISFAELIASELDIGADDLHAFMKRNPVVVLIDGLNEIPAQALRAAKAELRHLSTRWREAGFVLTARFPKVFRLLGFRNVRLAPFDDDRVQEFVERKLTGDSGKELIRELRRLPRLLALCRNPLLLHMLVELSLEKVAIPRNRGRLLDEFMTRFLIREEPQIAPISARTMRLLLSRLAFEMRRRRAVSLPEAEVERYVQGRAPELQAGVGAVDVVDAMLGAKLLHQVGDGRVAFFHELIQEYFAARELLGLLRSGGSDLRAFVNDRWWREVVVLAYGLADGSADLFGSLAHSDLALLARGVMDGPEPDVVRQRDVVEQAATVIERGVRGQASAFEALAVVWTDDALRRVGTVIRSERQAADFVERFARDPYSVALDLLRARPTGAIGAGIAVALQRSPRPTSRAGRTHLFNAAVRLIVRKANGEIREPSYKSLCEIALLGTPGDEASLLHEGISALLDVHEVEWADRLAAKFTSDDGLDARLSARLATELVLNGSPARSLRRLDLTRHDWRELVETALLGGRYDWAIQLCARVGSDGLPVMPLRPLARQLLRRTTGKKTGEVLQAVGGRDAATRLLRSMLLDLEVPPTRVGEVTSWLGDPGPLRSRISEYLSLALRQGFQSTGYADIVRWAREGDIGTDIGQRLLDLLLKDKDYAAALLIVHGSGLRGKYQGLFTEAEKALDPTSAAPRSSRWVNVAYDKCWQDWSPQFRSRLIDCAQAGPSDMDSRDWSREALESFRVKLRMELNRLERVVPKAAFELAGIEEEAIRAVVDQIGDIIRRGDGELAFALVAEWTLSIQDLRLDDGLKAVMQQTAGEESRRLARADETHEAFRICDAWGVDPREALGDTHSLSTGHESSAAVAAGFDHGVFLLPEVEAWFLGQLQAGATGGALGLRTSKALRRGLHGAATLGALELLRDSRYKEAGQVIAAFDLEEDFGPELEEIIPDLIQEGKSGIAHQLVRALGPRYSAAFADQVLEAAQERLSRGELAKALGLVESAGLGFVREEFRQRFPEHVANAIEEGRREGVRRVVEVPAATSLLTPRDLIRALDFSSARVPAVVRRVVGDRGYCFARLTGAKVDVFVHGSVIEGSGSVPATGARLLVSVASHPKGPRATWATLSDAGSHEPPKSEPTPLTRDSRSLRELRDAWGAHLREP